MPTETLRKLTTEIKNEILNKISSKEFIDLIAKTKAASDSDTGTFEVVISTADLDRQGEIIKQEGIDTVNYMKNPVVLWGHDYYSLPIGICDSIELRDGKTIAKGRFAPADANPLAQQVRRMYDAKMVSTTSVGGIPKQFTDNVITEFELLEFSFVPVPANPFALSVRQIKDLSLDLNMLVTKGMVFSVKAESDEEAGDTDAINQLHDLLKAEHDLHTKNMDDATKGMSDAIMGDSGKSAKSLEEFKDICMKAIEEFKAIATKEHGRHSDETMKMVKDYTDNEDDADQNTDDSKSAAEGTSILNRAMADEIINHMKAAIAAVEGFALKGSEGEDIKPEEKGRKSAGFDGVEEFLKSQKALRDVATIISDSLGRMNKTAKEIRSK